MMMGDNNNENEDILQFIFRAIISHQSISKIYTYHYLKRFIIFLIKMNFFIEFFSCWQYPCNTY